MADERVPLAKQITWCWGDLNWKAHHGWPEDDLATQRAVLASLERMEKLDAVARTILHVWEEGTRGTTPFPADELRAALDAPAPEAEHG